MGDARLGDAAQGTVRRTEAQSLIVNRSNGSADGPQFTGSVGDPRTTRGSSPGPESAVLRLERAGSFLPELLDVPFDDRGTGGGTA